MKETITIDGKIIEPTPEQRYIMRFGHKPNPIVIEDFVDHMNSQFPSGLAQYAMDFHASLKKICIQAEKDIEKLLKAGMFLLQDYNTKNYTIIKKTVDEPRQNDNIFRSSIEIHIKHKKSSRNGHRKNHALSFIYRNFAEELVPKLIFRNHLFIPFDILHGKLPKGYYRNYILGSMATVAEAIGISQD